MPSIHPTIQAAALGCLFLGAAPAVASELACNVFGTQYAEWRGSEYRLSQSKAYREVHRFRLVTGDKPKVAFRSKERDTWVWEDLSPVSGVEGSMYSGMLKDGGILTAAVNNDETKIILNYLRIHTGDRKETVISSATGIGDCVRR
jgi:hypothetical protein